MSSIPKWTHWEARPGPTKITYQGFRFVITHRPAEWEITNYIADLKEHGVTTLVRVCESSYKATQFKAAGIDVVDLKFDDGCFPSKEIIDTWFSLLRRTFLQKPGACVAVHCISGLGRAPVLVILALIELGLKCEAAVNLVRSHRRYALNAKQLVAVLCYNPNSRLKLNKKKPKKLFKFI